MINNITNREVRWILKNVESGKYLRKDDDLNRISLEEYMNGSPANLEIVIDLYSQAKSRLLSDEELDWINHNDARLLRWLKNYCTSSQAGMGVHLANGYLPLIPSTVESFTSEQSFFSEFIDTFDTWTMDISRKKEFIDKAKLTWSTITANDHKLKWIDKNDDSQLQWIWKYLCENINGIPYSPTTTGEMYSYILTMFDMWNWSFTPCKEILFKMKQAWAQQKYRRNLKSEKKIQRTYALREKTTDNLNELAIANNVNISRMLEYLINTAHKNLKKGKAEVHSPPSGDNN